MERKAETVLPRKTVEPEEYAELEQELRRSKHWATIASMDVARLKRIWLEREDDPGGIKATIERFVTEAQVTKARLRKRDD